MIGETMSRLRICQKEYQIEALVAKKQATMLANGRGIACDELPIFCDPDTDPFQFRKREGQSRRGPASCAK